MINLKVIVQKLYIKIQVVQDKGQNVEKIGKLLVVILTTMVRVKVVDTMLNVVIMIGNVLNQLV